MRFPIRAAVVGGQRGRRVRAGLRRPGRPDHADRHLRPSTRRWSRPGGRRTPSCGASPATRTCWPPTPATPSSWPRPWACTPARRWRPCGAGKHVLSEVIAATTLEECWALVEAVERSPADVHAGRELLLHAPQHDGAPPGGAGRLRRRLLRRGGLHPRLPAPALHRRGAADLAGRAGPRRAGQHLPHALPGPGGAVAGLQRRRRRRPPGGAWSASSPRTWPAGATPPSASAPTTRRRSPASSPWATRPAPCSAPRGGAWPTSACDAASPRPHNMTHYHLQGTSAPPTSPPATTGRTP